MKYKITLLILAIIIGASTILSFIPVNKICGIEGAGCSKVQSSEYQQTLGLKNSHLGLVAFSILFLVNYWHIKRPSKKKRQFLILGMSTGSTIAIYFIYLQFFVLNAICTYCMITDIGIILSLILILVVKEK